MTIYIPKHFASDDAGLARTLIAENSFAQVITPGGADIADISHLPLILVDDGSTHGKLIGHFARANPHWKRFEADAQTLVIFSGPHAYISPNWYANPGLVPTWNYAAVHVKGTPQIISDDTGAADVLRQLVGTFESDATGNWSVDSLPEGSLEKQLRGIVAFEMSIDDITLKVKMSQNRGGDDVAGAIEGLSRSDRQTDHETAQMMKALNAGR